MPTTTGELRPVQLTPMHARDTEPTWWRSSVSYQVYPPLVPQRRRRPRRHHRRAGTAGGTGHRRDLALPFYPSSQLDGGYDVNDYCDVDPSFGALPDFRALEDFDALVTAPHSPPGGRTGSVRARAPGRSSQPATTVSDS